MSDPVWEPCQGTLGSQVGGGSALIPPASEAETAEEVV